MPVRNITNAIQAAQFRIKFKDIFNLKEFYRAMHDWLAEYDWKSVDYNEKLELFHTPGHTPGHIVIVHHKTKTVWVGDVPFKNSIGRTDFPKGNHEDLINSIKNKLFSLPGDYQFVPGHGVGGSLEDEKKNNPFLI